MTEQVSEIKKPAIAGFLTVSLNELLTLQQQLLQMYLGDQQVQPMP